MTVPPGREIASAIDEIDARIWQVVDVLTERQRTKRVVGLLRAAYVQGLMDAGDRPFPFAELGYRAPRPIRGAVGPQFVGGTKAGKRFKAKGPKCARCRQPWPRHHETCSTLDSNPARTLWGDLTDVHEAIEASVFAAAGLEP